MKEHEKEHEKMGGKHHPAKHGGLGHKIEGFGKKMGGMHKGKSNLEGPHK